ncbi:MAG: hypothetical protein JW822_06005 [Spirochaetales bacterium]|nr:hypothetical protein [Spirochaetales bacterium]
MKIKLLLVVGIALLFMPSCMSMSMETISTSFADGNAPEKAVEIIKNQDIIEIDTIAFEIKDLLGIRQKLGQEIATYQRIPNPNYTVSSAKLFTTGGKELYTLVPNVDQFGVHIHIKNNLGRRGNIDITVKPELSGFASMTVKFTINTNFFNQPYTFHIYEKTVITASFSPDQKTNGQYILYHNDNPVLAYVSMYDMSHPENNKITIVADHEFVTENKYDLAAWCVIFILIQDVNEQLAADARQQNANRNFMDDDYWNNPHDTNPVNTPPPIMTPPPATRWNNNGTLDNNNNPFDNF